MSLLPFFPVFPYEFRLLFQGIAVLSECLRQEVCLADTISRELCIR